MKQKLFDKFAELFGSSEGARFYFAPGTREPDRRTHGLQRGACIPLRTYYGYICGGKEKEMTAKCIFIP